MWLFFAILAPICWALVNPLDSALRRNFIKSDMVLTLGSALGRLPLALVLIAFFWDGVVFGWPFFWIFVAGILWSLPFIFYFKALKSDDTSRVVLIMQFNPVFTLLLAFFLINESLSFQQLIAFVLILCGSLLAATKKVENIWHFSKAFVLMALACSGWALADVLFKKYAVYFPDFWSAFAVDVLGCSVIGLFLFMPRYRKFVHGFGNLAGRGWFFFIIAVTLGTVGSLAFAYALTLGKASLTAVIIGIQPLLAFFTGHFWWKFFKEIPKESFNRVDLFMKGASLVFIVSGMFYLYL